MKIQQSQLNASIRSIKLPDHMRELPVSKEGFPVPHFAGKNPDTGERDFRAHNPETMVKCMRNALCWVCGQRLGQLKSFVAGPMCVVTRTSSEPPCHYSCAAYSAIACPFLATPRMRRNAKDLPEGHLPPAGIAIMRNPGVVAVLVTRDFKPFKDGKGGVLIQMGEPERIEWYAQRREATREEVMESIGSGLLLLKDAVEQDDDPVEARAELARRVQHTHKWLPAPAPASRGAGAA